MKVYTNKRIENEKDEIWKIIPGYEKIYVISNHGRVKRLKGFKAKEDRILSWNWHKGYLMVTLCKNNQHNRIMVHIMVAKLFVPNPCHYSQVCHKDNNPSNPSFENLKWGTQSINIRDAHEQRRMGGEKHHNSILNIKKVRKIKEALAKGETLTTLSRKYCVGKCCISNIKTGKTWKFVN